MRYFIFLSLLIFCCCGKSRKKESTNGIWIPEVVDWKEGSFDTYYIKDDTVVIISSEQKLIKDSIYFRTEPGFNIMKGVLRSLADGKFLLPHRTLYRFIKLPGIKADEVLIDTIFVVPSIDTTVRLSINGKNFIRGRLYTRDSRESIISIITEMVPDIEKHPEKVDPVLKANGDPRLHARQKRKTEAVRTDSLEILSQQWKSDSLGCEHVRSINAFSRLLKGYSLAQKSEPDWLKVLGPPNDDQKYPDKTIVIYYFSSVCMANRIIKGSDKSGIEVIFDLQKRYEKYDTSIE